MRLLAEATVQRDEVRRLRATGMSVKALAAMFECHRATIQKLCFGIKAPNNNDRQSVRIRKAWKAIAITSPRQLAQLADVPLDVATRFYNGRMIKELFRELEADEVAVESIDSGKRIPFEWMLRWCSRWERTVGQCRALYGNDMTLAEVIASAEAVGLSIENVNGQHMIGRHGLAPREERPVDPDGGPRVYKLAIDLRGGN